MKQRSDGTTLISVYHYICGAINLLALCAMVSLPLLVGLAASGDPDGAMATMFVGLLALVVGGIAFLLALANFVVGWGLWQGRSWARAGALALAALRLLNIPLGTVVGGLIIWHLLRDEVQGEFHS